MANSFYLGQSNIDVVDYFAGDIEMYEQARERCSKGYRYRYPDILGEKYRYRQPHCNSVRLTYCIKGYLT